MVRLLTRKFFWAAVAVAGASFALSGCCFISEILSSGPSVSEVAEEYAQKEQLLYEGRRDELPTAEEVKTIGKVVETRTTASPAVFRALVERCVRHYGCLISLAGLRSRLYIPGLTKEEEQAKCSEMRAKLMAEEEPVVTLLRIRKGCRYFVFICCNDRVWEAYDGNRHFSKLWMNIYSREE